MALIGAGSPSSSPCWSSIAVRRRASRRLRLVSSHQLIAKMNPKKTRYAMLPLSHGGAAAGEGCVASLPPPDPLRPSCPHREAQSGRLPTRGRSLVPSLPCLAHRHLAAGALSFSLAPEIKY